MIILLVQIKGASTVFKDGLWYTVQSNRIKVLWVLQESRNPQKFWSLKILGYAVFKIVNISSEKKFPWFANVFLTTKSSFMEAI